MDWDIGPSPSQFASSSQWARASNRPASVDNDEVGYVSWVPSQPDHPVLRKLMHMAESEKEKKREQKPRSDASSPSSSTSVPHRTASLPVFATPSTSTLTSTSTSASNSSRKLHPRMKPISKKVPPSRAYSATAPVKDDVSSDPERAAGYLHIILNGTAKMDENSRLKQVAKAEAEKKAASGTPGDIAMRRNTCTSSTGSRFTSVTSTARPLTKTSSFSSASSSAPPLRSALSRSLSSATIKPAVKLSRDNVTYGDIQMMVDSDRDTDLEGSTFTDSLGDFAPDESFSMHVDDIVPPPKRAVGRTPSIAAVPSNSRPTASSSNSGFAPSSKALATTSTSTSTAFSEKIPQSKDVRPPVAPPATQRGPPPLGMRRQHNLPNSGFPLSQSRYATTQSPYVASQAKGQKQVTLPPFKPPLLKKPNPRSVPAPKHVVQTPESPPTSTPELDKDDSNDDGDMEDTGGAAGADSSFDVSFDVDADALEATMRQYD